MSLLPDLTPLISQIKEFNQNQLVTNQLLTQILTEIRSIKNTSIVEDQLRNKPIRSIKNTSIVEDQLKSQIKIQ